MTSFQASYHVATVAQALQSLTALPGDFDVQKNMPCVTVNAAELVNSVALLWSAMRDQRGFLETVEKEMSKRKTEMEVRFQKMHTDVEGLVTQEAKKRSAEDDRLRQEIVGMRDEMKKHAETAQREAREAQEAAQRSVDRVVSTVKASVTEAQQRISDMGVDISNLKDELQKLRADRDTLQATAEKTRSDAQSQFTTLCNFIGASPTVVQQAVSNGTEKDAMLKTPALQTLAQRIRMADDKAEAAKTEGSKTAVEVQQLMFSVSKVSADVTKLDQTVSSIDQLLRDAIIIGDDKLSQRIDLLERGLTAQLAHLSKQGSAAVAAAPTVTAPPPTDTAPKKGELDALRAAFDQLKHDIGVRIASKADQADVNQAIASLNDIVARHDADIASLFANSGTVAQAPRRGSVDFEDAASAVADLSHRVGALESRCTELSNTKADRAELRIALADLAKKMEVGLSELYQQLQAMKPQHHASPPPSQDATAGRFRCISCNRDAGPLQEQVQERLSKAQFPPSPMIVSQASHGGGSRSSGPIIQSRQPVPGMRDYGGGMTSSRKKLMNYYVWLQDKNDNGPPPGGQRSRPTSAGKARDDDHNQNSTTPRSRSPGSQHPWSGAQSGNGAYGERQCGDHGTPEPEAIGLDGKYYVGVQPSLHATGGEARSNGGVNSRPRSAPLHGRGVATPPPS